MTAGRIARPLADPVALLECAVRYTEGSLRLVTVADLSRGTPCSEWNLRDLLAHMNDSLVALEEAVLDRAVVLVPASVPDISADPVGAVTDRACALMRSWAAARPGGDIRIGGAALSSDVAAAAGALEVAVHGWDVAQAVGHRRPIPRELARELLSCAEIFVTDADRPTRFAAPVPVSPWAGPGERLVAGLGRVSGR